MTPFKSPLPAASWPRRPRDDGLCCLTCGYNLTGLTINRCPECGNTFDIEVLRRIARREPLPAVPLDHDLSLVGFLQTWWLAAFHPVRLARDFPGCHSWQNASTYSTCCYAISVAVAASVAALASIDQDPSGIVERFFGAGYLAVAAVVAALAVETLIASWFGLLARPVAIPRPRSFWRGLVHYTSGFIILSALFIGVALSDAVNDRGWLRYVFIAWFGVFAWWLFVLEAMLLTRAAPGWPRWAGSSIVVAMAMLGFLLLSGRLPWP